MMLSEQFQRVRQLSEQLAAPLSSEDCAIQSMPEVSPTRWHLAHTTWFFETFLLKQLEGYREFDPSFEYLFNSYYNTVGDQYPQARRGLLSRPGFSEVLQYRRQVDRAMIDLLDSDRVTPHQERVLELGLNHEQQHQELILTDIKHVLSCNPLWPAYREAHPSSDSPRRDPAGSQPPSWISVEEGLFEIGHDGDGFAFDNESPRHRVFLESFELASRCVTNGEYQQFIEQGGYQQPQWWLSLGWDEVQQRRWTAPLYWVRQGDRWMEYTLSGLKPLDPHAPVCHVSYFEADAFARWAGARLPTEAEWEVAAARAEPPAPEDRLVASDLAHPPAASPAAKRTLDGLFGNVWQWTSSPYTAYPGYQPPAGALGEYNGKFMCNQYVLRAGSCATPATHIRPTYRNFFPPEKRWQFSGIRLAR